MDASFFIIFSLPSFVKFSSKIVGQRSVGILPSGTVSFKWTPCSRALALFFVRAKLLLSRGSESTPILEGYKQSPAASLGARLWKRDYAWIHDVFGSDRDGSPLLRQILIGINVRQKTKAPIQLFLKTKFLPVDAIEIFIREINISDDLMALKLLSTKLLEQWSPGVKGKNSGESSEEKQIAA